MSAAGEPVDLLDLMELPGDDGMNQALREWVDEGKDGDNPRDVRAAIGASGPCNICQRPASGRCLRCDRPACANHRALMTGLCDACVTHKEPEPRSGASASGPYEDEAPAPHDDLGIPWIE